MTKDQARTYRVAYGAVCGGTAVIGVPTLILSILKIGYEGQIPPYAYISRVVLRVLHTIMPEVLDSILPLLSDYKYYGWMGLVSAPTALLGSVLTIVAILSGGQAFSFLILDHSVK